MSRVVMVRQGLSVPGDPRVWREATALRDAGHQVCVVASKDPGQPSLEVIDGISVRRYRCPEGTGLAGLTVETLAALLGCLRHLMVLRTHGRIDVLHAFNPPDTLALLAWLLPGTKLVYDQADPVPELLRARGGPAALATVMGWFERRALRKASLVIAINDTCRQLAIERGPVAPERVAVVRIGPTALNSVPHPVDGLPVVAFAGVIGVQDGVDVLLHAYAQLLRRRPGLCELEIIGDGPAVPALKGLAAELGVPVRWSGWLTGEDFRERLGAATVCVSPDADTPFNKIVTMVKATDYLAAGKAAVLADLPETRVTCGDAARYFPAGDACALADALEALLDSPAELAELERRAVERGPLLLWEHSAARLVAAYAWLLGTGPAVRGNHAP